MTKLLSLATGWQSYVALALMCFLAGTLGTWRVMSWREGDQQKAAVQRTVTLIERDAHIDTALAAVFVPQFVFIHDNTAKNSEEIPQHVTPQIDKQYPVPLGFVRVWNNDAHGPVPGPASGSDADPSGVPLSDVAQAHNADQGILDTCRTMNNEWWSWYDQHKAAWK